MIIFPLEDPLPLTRLLCNGLFAEPSQCQMRRFPDGETYLRVDVPVSGEDTVILANLSNPDAKILPLIFLAETLKELGASSTGLIAPYLCYMRQDRRFVDGEAITSRIFAQLLSAHVDWLVTVDPHLHRYGALEQIYSIPCSVVNGAPALSEWLDAADLDCFLVGPDAESEQWVSKIARVVGCEYVIGSKIRRGDRDVDVSLPDLARFKDKVAVVIDDVISTGQTLLKCVEALQHRGIVDVSCCCVHGLFADGVDSQLADAGVRRIVSANTIPHETNQIDVSSAIISAVREIARERSDPNC